MLRAAEDILRFAETARPGDAAAYGRGSNPPRELVQAMRQLVEAGALMPVAKREGRDFLFMVVRGDGPVRPPRPARGAVRRGFLRPPAKTGLSAVLAVLADAARRGQPCPTNEELAALCGLSGRAAASYRVRLLARQQRIAVEDRGPMARRVVTILKGRWAGCATAEAAL